MRKVNERGRFSAKAHCQVLDAYKVLQQTTVDWSKYRDFGGSMTSDFLSHFLLKRQREVGHYARNIEDEC
jgi:hypothetical protein